MPITADTFRQIHGTLKAFRLPLLDEWQEITDLMLPAKSDVQTKRAPGEGRMVHILDPTAMENVERLTGHIYSLVLNFQSQWFQLEIEQLKEQQPTEVWLHEVAIQMQKAMIAADSPIPQAAHEMLLQYVGPGTGCLWVSEQPFVEGPPQRGFRGFTARSQPIGSYAIAENGYGRVDTVFRDLELSPRQAAQNWGIDALSDTMQEVLRNSSAQQMHYQAGPFSHGVLPTTDDEERKEGPFRSVYVEEKTGHIVSNVGLVRFPYMVPRWSKANSFSPWGYGRGQMALPDARVLNTMDADALRSYALNNAPYNFFIGEQQETINRLSYLPGAANVLAKGSSVVSGRPSTDFNAMNVGIAQRQERIRRLFFMDVLEFLPPPEQRTQRTLGELQMRGRVMAQLMGPAFGRFLSEFLNPFLDVVFFSMLAAGALPEVPEELVELARKQGVKLDPTYEGPLANAQRIDDLVAIDEGLNLGVQLATETGDRTLLEVIDLPATYRRRLEVSAFPKDLIRDPRVYKQKRDEAIAGQQAQAEAEEVRANAQAAGQAAPAMEQVRQIAQPGAA